MESSNIESSNIESSKLAVPDAVPNASQRPQGLTRFDAKREAKLQATKGIKRRNTLIGKADDLHKECGYNVLLALQKGHHSYVYTSVDTPDVIADLMQRYLFPVVYTPALVRDKKRKSNKLLGKRRSRETQAGPGRAPN